MAAGFQNAALSGKLRRLPMNNIVETANLRLKVSITAGINVNTAATATLVASWPHANSETLSNLEDNLKGKYNAGSALDAKWVKTVTYVKDDDASLGSKTLSYLYPSDKWGGYCSLTDDNKATCGTTVANYG